MNMKNITDKNIDLKKLLKKLANQTPGALYQFNFYPEDETMFCSYISEGVYEIFELYPEEVMEDVNKVFARIHPDDKNQIMHSIRESTAQLKLWKETFRVVLPQKGERWIQGNAKPEKKDDGCILWHGNLIDISEEKEWKKEIEIYAKALKNISDSVVITDKNFKIEYINKAAKKLFGYSPDELKGESPGVFNSETHSDNTQKKLYKKISRGEVYQGELLYKRKDGSNFICDMKITPLTNGKEEIYAYIGIQRDITAKKNKQQEIEFQLKFQKTLSDVSSDLLNINSANIDRKINSALKKIGKFFNIDRSYIFQFSNNYDFVSNTHEWCKNGIEAQIDKLQNINVNHFSWAMNKLYNNQVINIKDIENMDINKEAEKKLLKELNLKSIVIMPMHIENELFGFFGFDFVEEKRDFSKDEIRLLRIFSDFIANAFSKHIDYQKIKELTYHDSLTGLYNRRFFVEELKRLDTKRQLPISIIVADIDGLKIINDSFGHQKGDCLIKKSADLIKNDIRDEDILARHGGDEFAILLPQTSGEEAEKIVSRIKENTKKSKSYKFNISISFGIATKNKIEEDISEIFKLADDKMYQNKLSENKSIKNKIVQGLISTLEVKSNETKEHTVRMTKLSLNFGKYLNLSNSEINRLSLLSNLHDIGKITVDDKILKKSEKLTEEEWEAMKKHSEAGYNIANSSEEFALVAEEIYSHHERWDGNGYPRGLKGKEIPFLARIIFLIDTYDVITSGRPYKKEMSRSEALKELKNCAGSQFDPELAANFINFIIEKY
jgi:diguanylate cyclase (GGDEF)-like protein/PAS domain S-box-containing protein